MVPRSRTFRLPVLLTVLALAEASTGCSQVANAGLALLGMHRDTQAPTASRPAGPEDSPASEPKAAAPGTTSIYETMPGTAWGRYAIGDPASPAFAFSRMSSASSCVGRPWGVSRVLPVGIDARPLSGLDAYGVTADPATRGEDVFSGGLGMARWSMSRTARMGTYAQGCNQNVFAYVRLGGNGAWEPVVVR